MKTLGQVIQRNYVFSELIKETIMTIGEENIPIVIENGSGLGIKGFEQDKDMKKYSIVHRYEIVRLMELTALNNRDEVLDMAINFEGFKGHEMNQTELEYIESYFDLFGEFNYSDKSNDFAYILNVIAWATCEKICLLFND